MTEPEYPKTLPKTAPSDGRVLVHNKVLRPTIRQGWRGFRYWLQAPADNLEQCPFTWAPELGRHYRVKRPADTVVA